MLGGGGIWSLGMAGSERTVVWFRRDLRIDDNPALAAAARDGVVLPVFIWCPADEGQFYPGRCSRWWLKQSLPHLSQSLESLGCPLVLIRAESTIEALLRCIDSVGATRLVYNHLYGIATFSWRFLHQWSFLYVVLFYFFVKIFFFFTLWMRRNLTMTTLKVLASYIMYFYVVKRLNLISYVTFDQKLFRVKPCKQHHRSFFFKENGLKS